MHRSWPLYGKHMGSRLYFNHKMYFHHMGAVRIVSLAESCEKSRANRVAASRIRR